MPVDRIGRRLVDGRLQHAHPARRPAEHPRRDHRRGARRWRERVATVRVRSRCPLLRRPLMLVTILQFIACFQVFGLVDVMTRGGPGGATRSLVYYLFERAFTQQPAGLRLRDRILPVPDPVRGFDHAAALLPATGRRGMSSRSPGRWSSHRHGLPSGGASRSTGATSRCSCSSALFTFIWMLPALWSLIDLVPLRGGHPAPALRLTPTPADPGALRADPGRRAGRSLVRQQPRRGRHPHRRPARALLARGLCVRAHPVPRASGRSTCWCSSDSWCPSRPS